MKHRILVVDGDEALLESMATALVEAGYEIVRASNGFEALRDLDKIRPDAVVTETDLPMLDGLNLTKALRSKPETTDIPVIFISGNTDRNTIQLARQLGARKFLAKPFDMNHLIESLKTALSSK